MAIHYLQWTLHITHAMLMLRCNRVRLVFLNIIHLKRISNNNGELLGVLG